MKTQGRISSDPDPSLRTGHLGGPPPLAAPTHDFGYLLLPHNASPSLFLLPLLFGSRVRTHFLEVDSHRGIVQSITPTLSIFYPTESPLALRFHGSASLGGSSTLFTICRTITPSFSAH